MINILMVEDDLEISELLNSYLSKYNMDVFSIASPLLAMEKLSIDKYDLILLDLGLPDMDGLELAKIIKKEYPNLPIIVSTARVDVSDKVVAFDIGVDDYVSKPYDPRELVARIQSIIKKYSNFNISSNDKNDEVFSVNKHKMQISHHNKVIDFTLAEYDIFTLFLEKKHHILSREFILNSIESVKWDSGDRSIDVIIARIRHKIGDNIKQPLYIKSIRGAGYKYIGT